MLLFSTDWSHDLAAKRIRRCSCPLPFHVRHHRLSGLDAITKAYRLYLEHIAADDMEEVLSLTRAWTLVRFFDADLLQLATCSSCGGGRCGPCMIRLTIMSVACNMPSRAGKGADRLSPRSPNR